MTHVRYLALEDQLSKLDQARALIAAIAPQFIGDEPVVLYKRLASMGWEWRIDGWIVKVESK